LHDLHILPLAGLISWAPCAVIHCVFLGLCRF
jgi:hypothetical protein